MLWKLENGFESMKWPVFVLLNWNNAFVIIYQRNGSEPNFSIVSKASTAFPRRLDILFPFAGVEIPEIFAAFNKITQGGRRLVKEIMPDIEDRISKCVKCGKCEKMCPQNIKIIEQLKSIKDKF